VYIINVVIKCQIFTTKEDMQVMTSAVRISSSE